MSDIEFGFFVWDVEKERLNIERHGVDFIEASYAFQDPHRILLEDVGHSQVEDRYYCVGRVGDSIMTVRYTLREGRTRIIGAGRWRKGRKYYEEKTRS